ncbi:unnamed protein product [Arabidopsis halleri]
MEACRIKTLPPAKVKSSPEVSVSEQSTPVNYTATPTKIIPPGISNQSLSTPPPKMIGSSRSSNQVPNPLKEPPLEVQKERIDRFRVVATELSLQEIHTLPSLPSLPSHSQMQDYTNKGQAGTSSSCDGSVTVAITPMASSQVDGKAVEVYSSTETLPDDPCAIQDRRTVVSLQDETEEEDNGSGDEDNWLTKKKKKSQAITGSFSDSLTKFRTKAWRRATSGLKEAKAEAYSKQKFTCWDFSGDVTQIMKSWGFKDDGLGLGRLNQGRRDIIQPIPLPYDVIRQGLGYSCDYIRREREDLLKQDAKYRENRCNVTTISSDGFADVRQEIQRKKR